MNFKNRSNDFVFSHLQGLVRSERKITAEIVECILEIDCRKIYMEMGYTSMFSFLTKELGYTPSSAQRRLEAARLLRELPKISEDLQSGALNLTQISVISQGIRQKKKDEPKAQVSIEDKNKIITEIKNHDLPSTERMVAKILNVKPQQLDRKRHQQDQSIRIEATFSKEQMQAIERVKELISHTHPNPNFAEIVSHLAEIFLQQKDPLLKNVEDSRRTRATVTVVVGRQSSGGKNGADNNGELELAIKPKQINKMANQPEAETETETETETEQFHKKSFAPQAAKPNRYIPAKLRAAIFQRDLCCQWQDKHGNVCGSRFQLQIDHKLSLCDGGTNEPNNLEVLCSKHNALKYRYETGSF